MSWREYLFSPLHIKIQNWICQHWMISIPLFILLAVGYFGILVLFHKMENHHG